MFPFSIAWRKSSPWSERCSLRSLVLNKRIIAKMIGFKGGNSGIQGFLALQKTNLVIIMDVVEFKSSTTYSYPLTIFRTDYIMGR